MSTSGDDKYKDKDRDKDIHILSRLPLSTYCDDKYADKDRDKDIVIFIFAADNSNLGET